MALKSGDRSGNHDRDGQTRNELMGSLSQLC